MDNYFFSKIALSLLLSGVLGFFIGCWWAWSVFSSWRKRTVQTHATAVSELEAQIEEIHKQTADEKTKAQEARNEKEVAEARARATEARLRSLEETTRVQLQASDKDLTAVREMLDSVQPKVRQLEQKEAELATWMTRFDALAEDKDNFIAGIRAELTEAVTERDTLKTRLDEIVTEKDRTIAELMERLAGVSDAERELEQARERQKNLEEQLADYRQTIDTWETHVNSLTSEQTAKIDESSKAVASLRAELETVQAKLAERNEAISRLEADAALLSHLRQSMRERQTRIDGLKLQLEQSRDALHKTLNELVELRKFAISSRDVQAQARDAEIERLNSELEELRANMTERNDAISRLEADAALLSHVRQSMRERQTRIDGLVLQLAHAKEELAAAAKAGAVAAPAVAVTAQDDAAAIEELAMALAEKDRQIQLLEENLMAAANSNSSSKPDESQAAQEAAALQAACEEVASLHAAREEVASLHAAREEVASLHATLANLRADISDRDERLAAWESRYEATLGELHEEAGRLQSRIREMEAGRLTSGKVAAKPAVEETIPEPPVETPAPAPTPSVEVQARLRLATMRGIQFRPESDEIEPTSVAVLESALEALKALGDCRSEVEIAGHTDSWGDDAANMHLSERRATAVRSYLTERGVPVTLVAKGYGGSRPIADNLTADGRYANRRIEFIVKG